MSAGVVIATVGLVALAIALGIFLDRRRVSILPRPGEVADAGKPPPPPPDPAGTTPATALRLARDRVARAVAAQPCAACRGLMTAGPSEPIRFGGRALELYPLACGKCGATRALYVDVVA